MNRRRLCLVYSLDPGRLVRLCREFPQGTGCSQSSIHVSADYFKVFGTAAEAGRTFTPDEDRPGGARANQGHYLSGTARLKPEVSLQSGSDIVALIVGRGMRLATIGLVAGTLGALAAIALVACYLPARRATRLDPIIAMRQE